MTPCLSCSCDNAHLWYRDSGPLCEPCYYQAEAREHAFVRKGPGEVMADSKPKVWIAGDTAKPAVTDPTMSEVLKRYSADDSYSELIEDGALWCRAAEADAALSALREELRVACCEANRLAFEGESLRGTLLAINHNANRSMSDQQCRETLANIYRMIDATLPPPRCASDTTKRGE